MERPDFFPPVGERGIRRAAILLWIAALGFIVHSRVIGVGYFSDDFAFLDRLGKFLNGAITFREYLFWPHNEHVLPIPRLFWWATVAPAGHNPLAMRILLVAFHIAGAWGLTSIVYRHTRSEYAAWVGGSAYAAGAAFGGTASWFAVNFGPAATFTICGVALLAYLRERPAAAAAAAGLMAVMTVSVMQAGILVGLPLPLYVLLAGDRPRRERIALAIILSSLLALTFLLLAALRTPLDTVAVKKEFVLDPLRPFIALFLSPGRFTLSWIDLDWPGLTILIVVSAMSWAGVAGAVLLLKGEERKLLVAASAGGVIFCAAAALGRSMFRWEFLYFTGRYHYFLLLPSSVLIGFLAARLGRRGRAAPRGGIAIFATAAILLAMSWGSGRNLVGSSMENFIGVYSANFEKMCDLVNRLSDGIEGYGGEPVLADGEVPVPGYESGQKMTLSSLAATLSPGGGRFYRDGPVSPAAALRQNSIFDAWAEHHGLGHSPSCVVDGQLAEVADRSFAVFGESSGNAVLGEGFHPSTENFRWMGKRGKIHLQRAPGELAVESFLPSLPGLRPLAVAVAVDGKAVGNIVFGGESGAERADLFPLPPVDGAGENVTVTFESDRTWIPNRILEGNPDFRRLSIALRSIGFSGAERESGSCVGTGEEK